MVSQLLRTEHSATTRLKYENDIYKHIIPGIGKLPLAALKKSDLEKFYAEQMKSGNLDRNGVGDKKLSGAVIRSMHTRIKCALDQALKEGLINRNEAIGCKLPPKKNKEIEVLSHEEIARLLIQAKEEGFVTVIGVTFVNPRHSRGFSVTRKALW